MLTSQVPVNKEGYPFILFSAFCTLLAAILGLYILTGILLVATFFILCFFRDPERFVTDREDAVVSPADGKIIRIERVADNCFIEGEAQKISIFMNVFNVHVNRAPVTGKVDKVLYRPGKFYSADCDKAALQNEYSATLITTPQGHRLACVQIAGLIARRIVCWLEPGDDIIRGRRFGLIRFGSRVDLYLPLDTEILAQTGQEVRAGETILAHLR